VKVHFHWDRHDDSNENSSCWIRVSHSWAGKNWGAMWLPRIGQEVIVDFLEGDPDQPIITGRVYNGVQMPPYELPVEQTKSTIKSCSSKGGGGFNEVRFEDKKGSEQLFIHAQGRQDNRVGGNSYEFVGKQRHLIVKDSQFERVEIDQNLHVKGCRVEKVEGSVLLSVGSDVFQEVGGGYMLDAEQSILAMAPTIALEATECLELKVGGSSVTLTPGGIYIVGPVVYINSGSGPPATCMTGSVPPPVDPEEADSDHPGHPSS
jgi:type VI secretion system secreted protein VgrG